jgi:hypothetical protein
VGVKITNIAKNVLFMYSSYKPRGNANSVMTYLKGSCRVKALSANYYTKTL